GERSHRRVERHERREHRDVNAVELREPPLERGAELRRLGRSLEHLPVARYQHYVSGIATTPGRSLPSSSSSEAPPPVETQEMRSARPSSFTARTESPPPTTVYASCAPA